MAGELTDGLIHNDQFDFDDLGLTVDTGLALSAVGNNVRVDAIAQALAPKVADYYTYEVAPGKTHISAGSLAKAVVFADAAGKDSGAFGDRDLDAELAERVSTEQASAGRISDQFFPEELFESDYSNTIGQAFAVKALDSDGNALVDDAVDFLLAQQCEAGFFRLTLGKNRAADCDSDSAASASTDVTALAVINLSKLETSSPALDVAVDDAVAWLLRTQGANGSWGGEAPTSEPNANSTGLAGWALGAVDPSRKRTTSATAAAAWLRGLQAERVAPCSTALDSEAGAIAYDKAAFAGGRADGVTTETQDQFRRATAQALPAMLLAPAGVGGVDVTPSGFARAGSTRRVAADGLAPGQGLCVQGRSLETLVTAGIKGGAGVSVKLPDSNAKRAYGLRVSGLSLGTVTFTVLAAKELNLRLKKAKVPAQRKQKVIVKGLAVGESVRVKYRGKVVERGNSGNNHRFITKFKVGKKAGKQKVRVIGEFGNRNAVEKFRVVKGR